MRGVALLLACLAGCVVAADGDRAQGALLRVREGWVREAPPTARVLAAYGTLVNAGDTALAVVGGSAAGFARVELHRMSHEDGVMRMRRLERIEIAPGGTAELGPGGDHLMLFEPARVPALGERVAIRLELASGATVDAELEVRRADDAAHAHDHHDH